MANAEPQTVKIILIAQLRDDVAQAIVPTMPAAELELGYAGWQVQFVMGHQDFFGFDPEEARKRRDSLAAAVHVGGGNQ